MMFAPVRNMHIGFVYLTGYSLSMHTIVQVGNPTLRQIAKDIPIPDIKKASICKLISDMKKLLDKEEYGVALAAPQVGESLRLFIISGRALARGRRNAPDEPIRQTQGKPETDSEKIESLALSKVEVPEPDQIYINPVLLKMSRKRIDKHEGCLSIRGKWGEVPRAEKATLRAYDESGAQFTRGASGFLAHIFQHELDHLDGTLYTDKATAVYDDKPGQK